jgi:hypothetical protein
MLYIAYKIYKTEIDFYKTAFKFRIMGLLEKGHMAIKAVLFISGHQAPKLMYASNDGPNGKGESREPIVFFPVLMRSCFPSTKRKKTMWKQEKRKWGEKIYNNISKVYIDTSRESRECSYTRLATVMLIEYSPRQQATRQQSIV